jgi:hypothetical protein
MVNFIRREMCGMGRRRISRFFLGAFEIRANPRFPEHSTNSTSRSSFSRNQKGLRSGATDSLTVAVRRICPVSRMSGAFAFAPSFGDTMESLLS